MIIVITLHRFRYVQTCAAWAIQIKSKKLKSLLQRLVLRDSFFFLANPKFFFTSYTWTDLLADLTRHTGVRKSNALSADMIGKLFSWWCFIRWLTLSNTWSFVLIWNRKWIIIIFLKKSLNTFEKFNSSQIACIKMKKLGGNFTQMDFNQNLFNFNQYIFNLQSVIRTL